MAPQCEEHDEASYICMFREFPEPTNRMCDKKALLTNLCKRKTNFSSQDSLDASRLHARQRLLAQSAQATNVSQR